MRRFSLPDGRIADTGRPTTIDVLGMFQGEESNVRCRSVRLPLVLILSLVPSSVPSLALAQDETATGPDPSLVEVAVNGCVCSSCIAELCPQRAPPAAQ